MNPFHAGLRRLCLPDQATATEIVCSAWQWAREENLAPAELLERCVPHIRTVIIRSASELLERNPPDGVGIVLGTSFPGGPRDFIPRHYLEGLTDPPSHSPPGPGGRMRPNDPSACLIGPQWMSEVLASTDETGGGASGFTPSLCPCCGSVPLSEKGVFEIRGACEWEDDPVRRRDPDYAGGANRMSPNDARGKWAARNGER